MNPKQMYREKIGRLTASMQEFLVSRKESETVALGTKQASNLFRYRQPRPSSKIDVSTFTSVLMVDSEMQTLEVEGMATYNDIIDATLPYGLMPAVVPELLSITVGGALIGIGIEASSFRYGFVHETVLEADVLLADGRVVTCASTGEHADLFRALGNSYGTLGYVVRVKMKLVPTKKNVALSHTFFSDSQKYFQQLKQNCRQGAADFLEGVVFDKTEMYLSTGTFTDVENETSDYTFKNIYYRSIQQKKQDALTARDFIGRWDTDWFWCSKFYFAQNKIVRLLLGRKRLNSAFFWKLRKFLYEKGVIALLDKLFGKKEGIVQDVEIPIGHAAEFLDFLLATIGVLPIWVCPVQTHDRVSRYPLYPMDPQELYINFGFWGVRKTDKEDGYYNRLIERKAEELRGRKMLYSTAYYTKEEFERIYDSAEYGRLKAIYDPSGIFPTLYEKCVLNR